LFILIFVLLIYGGNNSKNNLTLQYKSLLSFFLRLALFGFVLFEPEGGSFS